MRSWTANDDPTGKPNYTNTADVFGVDSVEAAVKNATGQRVAPGWVKVTTGSGGRAGRVTYENLVVFAGDMASDALDDATFPDA